MPALSYTFPGRYASLSEIASVVRTVSKEAGLDEDSVNAVECAVDEACSNIIEHAYGAENIGTIDLDLEIIPEGIRIHITDHGKAFQPEKVSQPDTKAPLSQRKPSGLGLFMMKKCMDEVDFEFSSGSNTLTMVKFRNSGC